MKTPAFRGKLRLRDPAIDLSGMTLHREKQPVPRFRIRRGIPSPNLPSRAERRIRGCRLRTQPCTPTQKRALNAPRYESGLGMRAGRCSGERPLLRQNHYVCRAVPFHQFLMAALNMFGMHRLLELV